METNKNHQETISLFGKRYRIKPALYRFLGGLQIGARIALGFNLVIAIALMFLGAAFHYAVWH